MIRPSARVLALLVVAGSAVMFAHPAQAAFPGRNGLIAWGRPFLMTDQEIWGMTPDGAVMRQITHNDRQDFFPAWAPDGQALAFESSTATDVDVWILRADGTEENVTNDPGFADRQPSWSPDGAEIAFSRQSPFTGKGAIWVIGADGSNPRRLTESTSANSNPAWSPDGSTILFTSDRDGNLELYGVRPDGTNLRRLTFTPAIQEDHANWAPDGTKVAFDGCQSSSNPCASPNYEIFSVNSDGTGVTRLTFADGVDANPAWSPDGRRITFRSDRGGFTAIWKMNADGSNPVQLTVEEFVGGVDPDWQPIP